MTNRIDAIRARVAKATAGPWDWHHRGGIMGQLNEAGILIKSVIWPSHEYDRDMDIGGEESDLSFIAHSRADIPWLLAEVDRLTGENNQLSVKLREYIEKVDRWVDAHQEEEAKVAILTAERDALKAECQTLRNYGVTAGKTPDWMHQDIIRIVGKYLGTELPLEPLCKDIGTTMLAVAARVERETLERCIVAMRTSRNGITMRSMKIAALPRKYQEPRQ